MGEKKTRRKRARRVAPAASTVEVLDTGNTYVITCVLLSAPVYCEGEQVPLNVKMLIGNLPVDEVVLVKRIRGA